MPCQNFSVGLEPDPPIRNFSAVQEHYLPRLLAICYSPLAIRHLLFAIRCRFGSVGASPSHFSLVPCLLSRSKLALRSSVINYGLKSVA